jgi:hypothetical protein
MLFFPFHFARLTFSLFATSTKLCEYRKLAKNSKKMTETAAFFESTLP